MWKRYAWLAVIGVHCLFFGALPSCDVESPDRYVRPPIIKSFLPASRFLTSNVGDSLKFSIAALDPDDQSLDYFFVLGDSVAGGEPEWTYVVEDTGDIDVDGRVSNGNAESTIRWHLRRVVPVNLPPRIVSVSPSTPEFTVIVGGSVEFFVGAEDPEGKPLSYFQYEQASRRISEPCFREFADQILDAVWGTETSVMPRTVDVHIQQAHLFAGQPQSHGEIDRHGAFPDPALAGHHQNFAPDAAQALLKLAPILKVLVAFARLARSGGAGGLFARVAGGFF